MYGMRFVLMLLLSYFVCFAHAYDLKIILVKIKTYKQYEQDFFKRHQYLTTILNPTEEEITARKACELGWAWARRFAKEYCLHNRTTRAHRVNSGHTL